MTQNAYSWFKELSKIPRVSFNEKAVSDWLAGFAQKRGLKVVQDEIYNTIIFKPASQGYEQADTLMLQAHVDMVGEKNKTCNHDFTKDSIEIIEKNGEIWANQTTLGGDDGIGVAYMLAILDDDQLPHPALECVFTVQEEVGLKGAAALDTSGLRAKNLIGLDASGESTTVITSSGGCRNQVLLPIQWEERESDALVLQITGLKGGHSGGSIDEQRANSLKLAGILLFECLKISPVRVVACSGGLKENAIPREAVVTIAYDKPDEAQLKAHINQVTQQLQQQYHSADPDLVITVEETHVSKTASAATTKALANILYLLPFGTIYKNVEIEGHILASSNIGVLTMEDHQFTILNNTRAAQSFAVDTIIQQIELIAVLNGGIFEVVTRYGGWPYVRNSLLRDKLLAVYRDLRHGEMQVEATHGGLELGIFKDKMPDLDIVAIGPVMYDIHTPLEHFDFASFERTYEVLVELIGRLH